MKKILLVISILLAFFNFKHAQSKTDWMSFTVDNDIFLNSDSGYTNGFSLTWYDLNDRYQKTSPNAIVAPLLWSISPADYRKIYEANTLAQIMMTPEDISQFTPSENEMPYSGLLVYNYAYVASNSRYADLVSTAIGVVGSASGAHSSQSLVHDMTHSDQPNGWDTQLNNELVFMFIRGRVWRNWVSQNKRMDFLTHAEMKLGTIMTVVNSSFMFRYGKGLSATYTTPLLNATRITNPVSIERGWFAYAGMNAAYVFHQVFTDGNTFSESQSVDYKHEEIGVTAGIAYSWHDVSVTFSLNDFNVLASQGNSLLNDSTSYGSVTLAWKY